MCCVVVGFGFDVVDDGGRYCADFDVGECFGELLCSWLYEGIVKGCVYFEGNGVRFM